MPKEFKRFLLKIILLSVLIISMSLIASNRGLLNLPVVLLVAPALFFLFLSALMNVFLIKSTQKSGSEFIRTFMAAQALKMLVHLIVMTIIAFGFPKFAIQFIVMYALIYLVFTVLELFTLMPLVSKKG